MKIRFPAILIIVCAATLLCPCAWTQSAQVKIPFAFKIGNKDLPAGTYTFLVDSANPGKVKLTNASSKAVEEATVQTRLARISESLADARLVFDKIDGGYYLAELWLPQQDGYFLGGTGHLHTHVVIHGTMQP